MDIEQKYSANHYIVSVLLNYVDNTEIAIPEIQRPFVYDTATTVLVPFKFKSNSIYER